MRDCIHGRLLQPQTKPSLGPEVMDKMRMVFEQICSDNNIPPRAMGLRGTLALAIIRAAAKGHEIAEMRNAALTYIERDARSQLWTHLKKS